MKKILQFALILLCFSNDVFSARRKTVTRKTSSTSSTVSYATPTQDQCNVDIDYCFSRYCFDKKTLTDGVYSKCGSVPASTILINVEDCLATRAVIKQLNLTDGCKTYSYNRIVSLLNSKDTIETGLKKNTKECAKATKALQAAKNCYAKMISSDGSSSVELYDELESLCGFDVSGDSYMLNRFYQAGDYGDSNVGALEDLRLTGQNTQKRENWRQIVDATLAGYTEIAELACGAEDYKLTKVNQYSLDKRTNSEMVKLYAESAEIGRQTANQIVNHWFRETDCVNSPLPVGGLYWDYKKGGNPDCKIVCREGYVIGGNSSTCVKVQEEKPETFIGLNIGNDWVGETKKKEENRETDVSQTKETPSPSGKTIVLDDCPKGSQRKLWAPSKGRDGVCEVFFPKNGDGTCTNRYYCRHTGDGEEWFSLGSSRGNYDSWYDMKLNNDGDASLNKIWGTSYTRFGNNYSEELSREIKDYCLNKRGCKGETPKDEIPKQTQEEDKKQTTSNTNSDCDKVKDLSDTIRFDSSDRDFWKSFMATYTGECKNVIPKYSYDDSVWNPRAKREMSINMIPSKDCICPSKSVDTCVLPKADAWSANVVNKYIEYMNGYKGSCTYNASIYNSWLKWTIEVHNTEVDINSEDGGMPLGPSLRDLNKDMKKFRECVCDGISSSNCDKANKCISGIIKNKIMSRVVCLDLAKNECKACLDSCFEKNYSECDYSYTTWNLSKTPCLEACSKSDAFSCN
ncbi:MAG: hypothetical protein K6F04_01170 [bacterium]|nr:hypothetical protein [bacterium]